MNKFQTFIASVILISVGPFIPINGHSIEPQLKQRSIVYSEVDYLLWFANQDGLHYPTVATGSSPNLKSSWSSGVRTEIDVRPCRWDTKLSYSYYATTNHGQSNASIDDILSSVPSTAGIFEVGTKWNLTFNRLDWELGRKIPFHYFCLRPFFGIEGLDVGQQFHVKTSTFFLDLDTGLPATDVVESKNKNLFLGIGAKAGFNASFCLGAGFEFYGNFAGSILCGNFRIKQKYIHTDFYSSGSSTELVNQTKQQSQSGSIFNCDLGIGFDWRRMFQNPNLELLLRAGWEQHYYTDMVRFQDFYSQQISTGTAAYSSNGNLSLSGFTFGTSLGY